jgi:hypothetical protein
MKRLLRGRLLALLLIGLTVVGSAAAFGWNLTRERQPAPVFWDALEAGISTRGVTCTIDQNVHGRRSQQAISLDLVSHSKLRARSTLSQNGTAITTDSISTGLADYVRYTSITTQAGQAQSHKDFSKVLNVWSKQVRTDGDAVALYDQTVLGGCVVPLGNLSDEKRAPIMAELKQGDIFVTNFSKVKWQWSLTRSTYRFEVTVPPDRYVPFMKSLAKLQGLKGLDEIGAETYASRAPSKLYMTIGAGSHRIQEISYDTHEVTIRFKDFGKVPDTALPATTIPAAELQQRLQAVK